jgi:hypothetical protein
MAARAFSLGPRRRSRVTPELRCRVAIVPIATLPRRGGPCPCEGGVFFQRCRRGVRSMRRSSSRLRRLASLTLAGRSSRGATMAGIASGGRANSSDGGDAGGASAAGGGAAGSDGGAVSGTGPGISDTCTGAGAGATGSTIVGAATGAATGIAAGGGAPGGHSSPTSHTSARNPARATSRAARSRCSFQPFSTMGAG